MFRLLTLGTIDLRTGTGNAVHSVLKQPKRLALLVYLALEARQGPVSRDRLLGLLWPDQPEERARASLNQALHFLRRSLGPNLVVTRGAQEAGLAADALWCDATAFLDAHGREEDEQALALHQGELLPGLYVDRAQDFDSWLEGQRRRFREAAAESAWRLAEREERAGNASAAGRWSRSALELTPYDELQLQRLVRLLDRIGDRGGALAAFELFASRLATDLGSEPSKETQQLVAGIRSGTAGVQGSETGAVEARGSGLVEVVGADARGSGPAAYGIETAGLDSPGATAGREGPEPPDRNAMRGPKRAEAAGGRAPFAERTGRARWRIRAGIATAAVGLLAALWLWPGSGADGLAGVSGTERLRIVIAPFEDRSPNRDLGYLTAALTTAIVERLSPLERLEILTAGSGVVRPAGEEASNGDAVRGPPSFVVTGGVVRSGERLRITVMVTDASTGKAIQTLSIDRSEGNVLDLVDEVSAEIASFLRVQLGREMQLRRTGMGAGTEVARDLVQRAERSRVRAQELEMDGATEAAAAGFEHADEMLRLAEATAPGWAEPVVRRARVAGDLGWLHFRPPMRNGERARDIMANGMRHADRALRMDPHNASGFELREMLRYWVWLIEPGRNAEAAASLWEAEADLRRAVASDPSRARAWTALSDLLFQRGEFNDAYWAARRAYDADAYLQNPREVLNRLFRSAHEIGADDEAHRWCDELGARELDLWVVAHCRLSLLAWSGTGAGIETPWQVIEDLGVTESRMTEVWKPRLEILAAALLARSELPDSAEAVLRRATEHGSPDPELLQLEAFVRVLLGQPDSAAVLLARYVAGNPLARTGILHSRRFASLRGNPLLTDWAPQGK